MPKWTKEQESAFLDRGGSLLVSAAAGSGKTAVLVERVIQKLTDRINPVDADRLLIVTFTNAASAEMRGRISAKLSELSHDPNYAKTVERQLILMDKANISTIDAFCIKLVRENFQLLGISPDFRIADESEIKILQAAAMKETLSFCYAQNDPVFSELSELLCGFRDDSALVDTVLTIYRFMRSHPFCRDWLSQKLLQYERGAEQAEKSPWAKTLYPLCKDALSLALSAAKAAGAEIVGEPVLEEKLSGLFSAYSQSIYDMIILCEKEDFDGLYNAVYSTVFPNFTPIRKFEDRERLELIKSRWDYIKDIFKQLRGLLVSDMKRFKEDITALLPKVRKLFEVTLDFSDRLDRIKQEKNLADFADTEQFALDLLWEKTENGGRRKTALAERISESFDEILIDECQDSNEAQNMIFTAVSRNESNVFTVGDVKQSIYRFRQACPELFIEKKNRFFPYDGKNYPASVTLSKNFRSRREVTSAVNFFFNQLMSDGFGGVDYSKEKLICGASCYCDAPGFEPELALLELSEGEDSSTASADYIAQKILQIMKTLSVTEPSGTTRPARYSDFCILLRSPKNTAAVYLKRLAKLGIPAFFEDSESVLESAGIPVLVSLLRVIDNPMLDMDMLTVLLCGLFGFTTDDVTRLRLLNRTAPVFHLLISAAESSDDELREKSKKLLDSLEDLRRVCAANGVGGLISHIYQTLNLPEFFTIKYKSSRAAANLSIFLSFAQKLEKDELCSLNAFLGRITRMKEQGADIKGASGSSPDSAVQIMSIHRSKGLEFPFCFISDLARKFNKSDLQNKFVLHSSLGFACVRRDEEKHTEFPTVPFVAAKAANEEAMLAEELRLMYVAMTRAKEKLMLVTTSRNTVKELEACAQKVLSTDSVLSPYSVKSCRSYSQWILMCAIRHPQLQDLFDGKFRKFALKESDCALKTVLKSASEITDEHSSEEQPYDQGEVERLCGIIKENLALRYRFESDTGLPTKLSVSQISKDEPSHILKTPSFGDNAELSAIKKGTAIHTFMQFADYENAKNDLSAEIARLVKEGFITQKQADSIDTNAVGRFFASSLAKSIFSADEIHRELRFMMPAKARDIILSSDSDEEIMIQGIADCVILKDDSIVIIDYKSDAVKDMSLLAERYKGQLYFYRQAIARLFEADEKSIKCVIYSFALSDYIEV